MLSDLGIRYPSYSTRSGKQRGGNLFAKQKVTGILGNPVYIGQMRWGDAVHDGNHAPIIGKEQFDRVQNKLEQAARRRTGLKVKPKGRHYLLTSILRCSCGAHMVGFSATGRTRQHFYYACTRQNHEGGKYSCQAPRIPAEAIEEAIIGRIRDISRSVEARERIVERALACLGSETDKLRQEEDVLRRQQQKTKADIGRLVEVLKNLGAKALSSVQSELSRLESEDRSLVRQLKELARRQEPLERITDDAAIFIRNWGDVAELLDAATEEERMHLLRHYVEVVELHAEDPEGRTGTYALRLFPEVRPDQGFEWPEDLPEPPDGGSAGPETTNGDATPQDSTAASLTDSRLVCISDGKAPRLGLEPKT